MPIAPAQIRVAGNGRVSVAPPGTTLPTDDSTALNAAFVDVGALNEDGATLSRSLDSDTVPIWQSALPGRYLITGVEVEIGMTLMQFNMTTLPLYFGGGTIVATGTPPNATFAYSISGAGSIDERVMVIEAFDGPLTYRYVFPRVMVKETGDIGLRRTAATGLELTFGVMAPTSGTTLGYIYSNDQALAVA